MYKIHLGSVFYYAYFENNYLENVYVSVLLICTLYKEEYAIFPGKYI